MTGFRFANEKDASLHPAPRRRPRERARLPRRRAHDRVDGAYTIPAFRGHGYAAEVVARAVAEIEQEADRAVRLCWYVADWFDAHPDRAGLLEQRAAG
jgi:predicted GNAT family acetyltransferase